MTAGESVSPPRPAPASADSPAPDDDEFRPVRSRRRGSVSIPSRSHHPEFRPSHDSAQPSDKIKNESDITPLPTETVSHPPPGSESDISRNYPEAGQMPIIDGIQWETKKFGVEAWHTPEVGKRGRAGKTYLGKIGKRQLSDWSKLPPAEFSQMVGAWIELKRTAKGVT